MQSTYTLPIVTCLSLSLLAACQPAPLSQSRSFTPENAAATNVQSSGIQPLATTVETGFSSSTTDIEPVPAMVKTPASGEVRYDGQTLTVKLQLPPLSPSAETGFQTQVLDLTSAAKITATVKDSYNKTYTPVGADGNGQITYPANGIITLSFNNVRPDELLLVEAQVTETSPATLIPQADLAVALRHTAISNVTTGTMDFQSTAVAKTLKELLALNAARARAISLPNLNSLMQTITGRTGTAPNYSYAQNHPSLVNASQLATALQAQEPANLTGSASSYRGLGATVNLTVSGLLASDKLQVQLTDAATAVKTNLGNGSGAGFSFTSVTPGSGLKIKVSAFGTPSQTYTYSVSPSSLPTQTEGGSQTITITAAPNLTFSNFAPAIGAPGTLVTITGSGFDASTVVKFNGVTATSTFVSATQINATVPVTATDGVITLTHGTAVVTSASSFDVLRTLYVKTNATGSNTGTSWADAYTSLQTALSSAGENDEIWVAAGTYKPHTSDTNASFDIPINNLAIYGGFAGNESTLAARNITTHVTILSGDLQNDDNTAVTPFTSATPNSLIVLQMAGKLNNRLDGITIQGAQQIGMFLSNDSNLQLSNLTVKHNKGTVGAGMQIGNGTSFTAENLSVHHNAASIRGAGIHLFQASGTLNNSLLEFNQADIGAGINIWNDVTLTLTNSQLNHNTATSSGAGIHVANGSTNNTNQGNLTFSNIIMKNNSSPNASGIRVDNVKGTFTLSRAAFIGNTGGDVLSLNVYNLQQLPTRLSLANLLVANNSSPNAQHLSIDGENASYVQGVALRNITLANNTCTAGAGSRCTILNTFTSKSTYQNLLFWKDLMGGAAATGGGNVDLGTGGTPFVSFSDPDGADNLWFTADDGYHLQSTTTTAINKGITGASIPLQDIVQRNRIGNPEPGAYEFGY